MTNESIKWDKAAEARLAKAPFFIRPMARSKVEKAAVQAGISVITVEFMEKIKQQEMGK